MKIQMNGVTLEDVTVEEALQLLNSTQKKQKIESVSGDYVKRHYTKHKKDGSTTKAKTRSKVWWLQEEINYILSHPEMSARELHKTLTRHTAMAISVLSSALRRGKANEAGIKIQSFVNKYYNNKVPVTFSN